MSLQGCIVEYVIPSSFILLQPAHLTDSRHIKASVAQQQNLDLDDELHTLTWVKGERTQRARIRRRRREGTQKP